MASAQLVDNMAENLKYPLRSSLTEILRENYHWLMVDIRDTRLYYIIYFTSFYYFYILHEKYQNTFDRVPIIL